MKRWFSALALAACLVTLPSCSSVSPPATTLSVVDASATDADVPVANAADGGSDAGVDAAPVDKAAGCASEFGQALTNAFGRVDGIVVAVVPPAHPTCAQPNSDHVVVQVKLSGAVYRMVVNVASTRGTDLRVRFLRDSQVAMPAPEWAEGWHPGLTLDYAKDLGLHTDRFAPLEMAPLSAEIAAAINIGDKVGVYVTSSGGSFASSAHKVHRNGQGNDGAIFVRPGQPDQAALFFHFQEQTF
jgi:hypothetical protein